MFGTVGGGAAFVAIIVIALFVKMKSNARNANMSHGRGGRGNNMSAEDIEAANTNRKFKAMSNEDARGVSVRFDNPMKSSARPPSGRAKSAKFRFHDDL